MKECDDVAAACGTALAEMAKALKAFSFYPASHPLRDKIIQGAFQCVERFLKDGGISLVVQRNGFRIAGLETALPTSPLISGLAQELFARELQRLSLSSELTYQEFAAFIAMLALEPDKIGAAGGLGRMVKSQGITSLVVNEIDISAVFTKRNAAAAEGAAEAAAQSGAEPEPEDQWCLPSSLKEERERELSLAEVMARLSVEADDAGYRELARKLVALAQPLKQQHNFDELFPVFVAMAEQNRDTARSAVQRDCALVVLQQLVLGEATEHLLDHLENEEFAQKERIALILSRLGTDVVDPVIKRLLVARTRSATMSLAAALSRIGAPAVPALCKLLHDDRWQTVFTAAAVLGEIGQRDAVKGLAVTVFHHNERVRGESIRALAKIGGMEATGVLLELLRNGDESVGLQVITWLGNTRNHSAVDPLLQLVKKRDLLHKTAPLKKAALAALGRIGDSSAIEPLVKLVNKRHWFLAGRWEELQVAAVEAIGTLGGKMARNYLEEISRRGGRIGKASSAALASMVERKATTDG
ncbi:HEAT repeat domain-containing protein [Geomonas sp.]|uniref:HEAT repeat domain-containing protein n=1 Tax=Geomonas sp. TaxID=2651584 RepID=UPI002B492E60|nr:HEAT repeat domain-containing protein [Geomonas sp.]HJV35209.1 HEAT repeat domain-containing protein [Geomonas sp.]